MVISLHCTAVGQQQQDVGSRGLRSCTAARTEQEPKSTAFSCCASLPEQEQETSSRSREGDKVRAGRVVWQKVKKSLRFADYLLNETRTVESRGFNASRLISPECGIRLIGRKTKKGGIFCFIFPEFCEKSADSPDIGDARQRGHIMDAAPADVDPVQEVISAILAEADHGVAPHASPEPIVGGLHAHAALAPNNWAGHFAQPSIPAHVGQPHAAAPAQEGPLGLPSGYPNPPALKRLRPGGLIPRRINPVGGGYYAPAVRTKILEKIRYHDDCIEDLQRSLMWSDAIAEHERIHGPGA